jgi:hypothetical protein
MQSFTRTLDIHMYLFPVHDTLRMLLHSMATERDRLKQTVDMDNTPVATGSALGSSHSGAAVTSLKQTLAEV